MKKCVSLQGLKSKDDKNVPPGSLLFICSAKILVQGEDLSSVSYCTVYSWQPVLLPPIEGAWDVRAYPLVLSLFDYFAK